MTEEEKKAIEISKLSLCVAHKYNKRNMIYNTASLETLLDLLEKQQKQLEEYKSGELFTAKQMHYIEDNYIDKVQIKTLIKELEKVPQNQYIHISGVIDGFKELLRG